MKKMMLLMAFVGISFAAQAQKNTTASAFPESWAGNWQGELQIFNNAGKTQSVAMQLQISKIDSLRYQFLLIYNTGEKTDKRPYELQIIDRKKGLYAIDEKNSIRMEGYLLGEKLVYHFSVQRADLVISYEKQGKNLIFEVISGSEQAVSNTGGQKFENEDIPVVKTFPVTGYQKAILKKK